MADIVEVIHKINFEVEGQRSLNASADEIGRMIASIEQLQSEIRQLTESFKKTGDPATKSRIRGLTDEMNAQKNAVSSNITENKRLQHALQAEMRQISTLRSQLDQLERARKDDIAQIRKQQQEIKRLTTEMAKVKSGGLLGRIGGIGSLLGFTGGALLASGIQSTVSFLKDAVQESIQMGLELEGVERAFRRIGDPSLLDGLREATRGTVSDLELMKQAVQFRNFGLPIEQLATMLEFARMRAQETGQSIDYMVNSIVTGVARKSIMIIDNLGISAERVRDAMKETGDFASAVALIIQQDMAAAGPSLDTAADKLARINAELDNIKSKAGIRITFFLDLISTGAASGFNALFDSDQGTLPGSSWNPIVRFWDAAFAAGKKVLDARQLREFEKMGHDMAEAVYGQPFQQAAEAFRKADLKNRQTILDQAQLMYQSELELAKETYKDNEKMLAVHTSAIQLVYNRFIENTRNAAVNVLQLTDRDIAGASLETLNQWMQALGESRNLLNAEDAVAIEQHNTIERQLKAAIDNIKGATRATSSMTVEQRKLNAELERQKRILDEARESLRAAGDPRLLRFDQPNLRVRPPARVRTPEEIDRLRSGIGFLREQRGPVPTIMTPTGSHPLTPYLFRQFEQDQQDEQDRQEKRAQAVKDANAAIWQNSFQLHNAIIGLIQTEDAIRKASLDSQIAMQQMRLDAALRLSERGNDELLSIEMNRMEKLQEERERMARRQVATNAAMQASSAALAAVQAITTITTSGATAGVPGVIAAGIALAATLPAMFALVQSLTAQANRGFATGGYTGDGPKMQVAGHVHKGEFVFNKEITAKYRPIFEAIHKSGEMPTYVTNNSSTTQPMDISPLIEAFRQGQIVQEIKFDEHGIGVMTRKSAKADKRRWRGR